MQTRHLCFFIHFYLLFMHIALGLSVHPAVSPSMCPFKIYIWIPHKKLINTYFLSLDYLLLWSYALLKAPIDIL